VVPDPAPEDVGAAIDWSGWYLTEEEDMGQSNEQDQIVRDFRSALEVHALEQQWQDHIGVDQFFAWLEEEPLVRVSPDVYVLDDPPPEPLPKMWEIWRPGIHSPRFALEIVSDDWQKDYEQSPPKYAQLGTLELVIFDPEAARESAPQPQRVALQIYRREEDGTFVRAFKGSEPVWSDELDAWLVVLREGPVVRLRLARDPGGRVLIPTQEEARQAEQKARKAEQKARKEAERRQRQEQAAREEAERQLSAALAELARLRKPATE